MENAQHQLTAVDELFLQRAYELAARGIGSTAPNPPVGAVVVRDGRIVGEGYHHRAGDAHAEANALRHAGVRASGATLYVSLEPCRHVGRTPPCTQAVVAAGVARVVAGTFDPARHGGAAELRERGVNVAVADDPAARRLIESFAHASSERPYVAVKMAMSLDGLVARRAGVRERIGSVEEERYVRDLRTAYDAVMVGAGTVRTDDPLLTVRPPHDRERAYARVVVAGEHSLAPSGRIFADQDGYARTIVLVSPAARARHGALDAVAEVVAAGSDGDVSLDLRAALRALRDRGICSVLCEGGPKLAASLLAASLVDRVYWAISPQFLSGNGGVAVLSGAHLAGKRLEFDRVESVGSDLMVSGRCSAD